MLSELAAAGLELVGPDREIVAFGGTTTGSQHRMELLTYATTEAFVDAFIASDLAACVVPQRYAALVPEGRSALVTGGDAGEVFYELFAHAVEHGRWSTIDEWRGAGSHIAATAVIHDGVSIGDDCVIMDHVVVLPRTHIASGVTIKPNATIGGEGFQLAQIAGRRRLVPHAGGVYLGPGVTIGSQTCVDRGLFGELTWIDAEAHVDNLVHIAHSVHVGTRATIVACAEVSGSVVVGEGAWLGPACAINPGVRVGEHSLIGTGSTVVADVPPNAVAFGSPAKVRGWRCECGERLAAKPESRCPSCAREVPGEDRGALVG
jgi:UDP-3-O-[3-hydroxymyristoyl] glucosamine N-acyltransferase